MLSMLLLESSSYTVLHKENQPRDKKNRIYIHVNFLLQYYKK